MGKKEQSIYSTMLNISGITSAARNSFQNFQKNTELEQRVTLTELSDFIEFHGITDPFKSENYFIKRLSEIARDLTELQVILDRPNPGISCWNYLKIQEANL